MIKVDVQQNSLEWLVQRAGIPTASEFDNLVTSSFEIRKGEMPRSYLALKLAEKWTGGPLPGANVIDMEIGKILEEDAIPYYSLETGEAIERVGLLKTDDGRIGASPDGLLGDDCGIEIKCPQAKTHVKTLLDGIVPKDHLPQIHGSMFVTGRSSWKFMSFSRILPPIILTVYRDEEIQACLRDALTHFLQLMDCGWQRLCELNGGSGPVRRTLTRPEPAPPDDERIDILT